MKGEEDFGCLVCGQRMLQEQIVCGCGWRRTICNNGKMWVIVRARPDSEGKGGGMASWAQVPQGCLAVFGYKLG